MAGEHIGEEIENRGCHKHNRRFLGVCAEVGEDAECLGRVFFGKGVDKFETVVFAADAYIALYHLGSHRGVGRQQRGELVDLIEEAAEVGTDEVAEHFHRLLVGVEIFLAYIFGDISRNIPLSNFFRFKHHCPTLFGGIEKLLALECGSTAADHKNCRRHRVGDIIFKFRNLVGSHGLRLLENHHLTVGHHGDTTAKVNDGFRLGIGRIEDILIKLLVVVREYVFKVAGKGVNKIALLAVQDIHGSYLALFKRLADIVE